MIRTLLSPFVWIFILANLALNMACFGIDIGTMTWVPRSDWTNVKTYGAAGDGSTDDTTAIQNALNAVSSSGTSRTLYFPHGIYRVSSTLTMANAQNVMLVGCGNGTGTGTNYTGSMIQCAPTATPGIALFNPQDVINIIYRGLVWDGNNVAGCGILQFSYDGHYDGNIRHENESFRNFTVDYTPPSSPNNQFNYMPACGIGGGLNVPGGGASLQAEGMITNCRFYNCHAGFVNAWNWGNQAVWTVDGCEFDNISEYAVLFQNGGSGTVMNTHFQNNLIDIQIGDGVHVRHCSSVGASVFVNQYLPYDDGSVISDCWIDSWRNTGGAIQFAGLNQMVFDCTFTTPPAGATGAIKTAEPVFVTNQITVSNNYAPGLPGALGIFNPSSTPYNPLIIPPGLRFGTVISPNTTFLNQSNYTETASQIQDITSPTYGGANGGEITTAWQGAINYAAAHAGSIVYIPTGTYYDNSSITVPNGKYTIQSSPGAIFYFGSPDTINVNVTGNANITLDSLRLFHGNSLSAPVVVISGSGSSNYVTLRQLFDEGNGYYFDSAGAGFECTGLAAGTSVFMDHVSGSITVANSSAANVTGRWIQDGQMTISGTTAKTGQLGFMVNEGTASNTAVLSVTDNQNIVMPDWYDEDNAGFLQDFSLQAGSGTSPGSVVVQSFNHFSAGTPSTSMPDVAINNYSGLLFYNSNTGDSGAAFTLTQTGSNPVNIVLADMNFVNGLPNTSSITSAANLIDYGGLWYNNQGAISGNVQNTPATINGKNLIAYASGFDALRRLGEYDLSSRFGTIVPAGSLNTDGPPVLSYAFENDTTDEAGNANGVNYNVTFGDGEVGANAGLFNGTTSYVNLQNPAVLPTGKTAWTLCAWSNSTGLPSGQFGMMETFGTTTTDAAAWIGAMGTSLAAGGWNDDMTYIPNFWDGNWHFIVFTYDGTTAKLYADGVLKQSAAKSISIARAGAYVGTAGPGGGYWKGSIDQAQFYNYTLSQTDITYLYQRAKANAPLAAYWKLDESTGTTSADSSGNGVTGTWVNGPAFTADHPSQITGADAGSLSFNGSNQYVSLSNVAALPSSNAPRTLSAWAKLTASAAGNYFIAGYGTPGTDNAFIIGVETWEGNNVVDAGGWNYDMQVANTFNDQNWHLVTLTYDGSTERLYFDGVLRASQNRVLNTIPSSGVVGELIGNSFPWQGNVDDVRVYNRCLQPAEVASMYGLVAYWKLDETAGPTSYDATGNGVNGTWVSSPTPSPLVPSQTQNGFADPESLALNGSSQYLTLGNVGALPSGSAPRTMTAWARTSVSSGNQFMISYGSNSSNNAFLLGTEGNALDGGGFNYDLQVPNAMTDGNWHFVALSYDGTNERLYLDGVLKVTQAQALNTIVSAGTLGDLLGNGWRWNGNIDDVRIYNRALSQAELTRLAAGNP